MARKISVIQTQILTQVAADSNLAGLTSSSQTAIWRLWVYIQAVAISLLEQLIDVFKADMEAQLPAKAISAFDWLKAQVLLFQYSATTPQVPTLVNYVPTYATIDTTLQIVKYCSIERNGDKSLSVKVAKAAGVPLDASETTALAAYIDLIFGAGSEAILITDNADKLYIEADVYYNGLYAANIRDSITAAINAYLDALPFNGAIKIIDIEMAIKNTIGVNDVNLKYVCARKDATAYVYHGNNIIYNLAGGINLLTYKSYSGHIAEETTAGAKWADRITLITS